MTNAKGEVEALMNDLLPFAKKMLADYGEFHPFGGFMKADGSIVHVGAIDPSDDQPRGRDLWRILADDFRQRARHEGIRATALVADARLQRPNDQQMTDAVQVTLEHKSSYAAIVFLPYRVNDEGVPEFGVMFAQEGQRSIFA
jgi:hypothetical protein